MEKLIPLMETVKQVRKKPCKDVGALMILGVPFYKLN